MKRILAFLTAILMVAMLASVPMYAEEIDTTADEVVDETIDEGGVVIPDDAPIDEEVQEVYHTILSRFGEWWGANVNVIAPVGSGIVLLAAYIIVFVKNKKWITVIFELIKKLAGVVSGVNTSQSGVSDAVTDLSAKVDVMVSDFETLKESDDTRTKMVATVLVEMTTVLEMMQTAYANNRNVPQSFKDMINYTYSHCKKLVDSDKELAACVEAVKRSLEETRVSAGNEEDVKEV